jgi:AraC family transcriptional regulator of adaptative response/methylated-DNA-[protein]-cysteine methyltransferase
MPTTPDRDTTTPAAAAAGAVASRYTTDTARWEAVRRRDRRAGEAFVYAVRTTLIYCRPGCTSRLPSRSNVAYFAGSAAAARAGFRPCRKCRPDAAARPPEIPEPVLRACRRIEQALEAGEAPPALSLLAAAVGIGPHRLHRLFRRALGVSPKAYAATLRERRLRDGLPKSRSVADAIYGAGFGSGSRVYEKARRILGMTPAQMRRGAPGARIRYSAARSYLGWILVAATERGVCAIEIGDAPEPLRRRLAARFPQAELRGDDPALAARIEKVLAFIEAPERGLALPLDIQGTAFQKRVWKALQSVRAGSTTTYAALARRLGRPTAARAVAGACAANPLALAIPCHRVVRGDGGLGGYRWGIERKRQILRREGASGARRMSVRRRPPGTRRSHRGNRSSRSPSPSSCPAAGACG